ncbi:Chitinase 1 [Quaeritorhiza haematococci]|nr:Chitinase 1 [Quaeritorhiza haematococci]
MIEITPSSCYWAFALLALSVAVQAALPNADKIPHQVVYYWGRNMAKSQFFDQAYWEPSLGWFCENTNITVYHISSMMLHFDGNGAPAIDFAYHCEYPTNAIAGWPAPPAGFSALNCGHFAADIRKCQNLGRKIMLTITPYDRLSEDNATTNTTGYVSAHDVWNIFLAGKDEKSSFNRFPQLRPFGESTTLDGVHLMLRSSFSTGYSSFVRTLRGLMDNASGKKYYISASPRCEFPDALLGGTGVAGLPFTDVPKAFDYIVPYFLSSPNICGWELNNAGFWQRLTSWIQWAASIKPDLPVLVALPSYHIPQWVTGSTGDYISVGDLMSQNVVARMKEIQSGSNQFGGFALQDASFDALSTPCQGDLAGTSRTYGQILIEQLNLSINQSGTNTPQSFNCTARATPTILGPPKYSPSATSGSAATSTEKISINITGAGIAVSSEKAGFFFATFVSFFAGAILILFIS